MTDQSTALALPGHPSEALAQPNTEAISVLFDKDPTELSDQDIVAIVAKLREDRRLYLAGDQQAGNVKASKAKAPAKSKALAEPVEQLSLTDLDL